MAILAKLTKPSHVNRLVLAAQTARRIETTTKRGMRYGFSVPRSKPHKALLAKVEQQCTMERAAELFFDEAAGNKFAEQLENLVMLVFWEHTLGGISHFPPLVEIHPAKSESPLQSWKNETYSLLNSLREAEDPDKNVDSAETFLNDPQVTIRYLKCLLDLRIKLRHLLSEGQLRLQPIESLTHYFFEVFNQIITPESVPFSVIAQEIEKRH